MFAKHFNAFCRVFGEDSNQGITDKLNKSDPAVILTSMLIGTWRMQNSIGLCDQVLNVTRHGI